MGRLKEAQRCVGQQGGAPNRQQQADLRSSRGMSARLVVGVASAMPFSEPNEGKRVF